MDDTRIMKKTRSGVRRLVTGHNERGQAVVVSDGPAPVVIDDLGEPGLVLTELWATDESPAKIDSGPDPTSRPLALKPRAGGTLLRIVELGPDHLSSDFSHTDAKSVFTRLGAGNDSTADAQSRHASMHRTETIDYGIVLEGEVTLILDDSEHNLRTGDIIIQRGTNHGWSNRSDKPCRIAFVLIDGVFAK
jgi:hypothetical protein